MKIAALVIAVAVGTFGLSGWHAHHQSSTQTRPVSLSIAPVAQADPADLRMIHILGQVQPRIKVSVRTTVSLPIVELPFKEGDRVTKGGIQGSMPFPASILARLDDSDLKAALRAAEAKRDALGAEIEAARVRLTALESHVASSRVCLGEAERNWGRISQLMSKNLASQASGDEAQCKFQRLQAEHDAVVRGHAASQANLAVAQKNLRAAEAEAERARLALAAATIHSPINGVVTRINVEVGEVVTHSLVNPGTVLMEVADMEHMVLIARVDEKLVGKVQVGQEATLHLTGCGNRAFSGKVESVALSSTEEKDGNRYFKTAIGFETGGRAIPAGLSGEARIECPAEDDSH